MGISVVRVTLFVVDVFVAVTAVGGGIALIAGPEADRFPIDWLSGTSFSSTSVTFGDQVTGAKKR